MSTDKGDFNLFLGTSTGLLKGVSMNPRAPIAKTFHNLVSGLPPKEEEITCLTWDPADSNQILVGLKNRTIKIFDVQDKKFTSKFEAREQAEGEENYGALRGVSRAHDSIVTACESGLVKVWMSDQNDRGVSFNTIDQEIEGSGKLKRNDFTNEEERLKHMATLKSGRLLTKMISSPTNPTLIATGGKENDLQIWNLDRPEAPIFKAKNVRPDFLQLRVPVWLSDVCFPDLTNVFSVAYANRYGHIRLYDARAESAQRRPVVEVAFPEQALTSISATPNSQQVLVGTTTGQMALFDFRQEKKGLFRKYKGCVGGIRSICCDRNTGFFACAGLDKFVRVYDVKDKKIVNKLYVKSRLNSVILQKNFNPTVSEEKRLKGCKDNQKGHEIKGLT